MPNVTPPGDLKPASGSMSEQQARLRIRQERRRKRMFRVGAPAADLRFGSNLNIPNPVTAAQAGDDVTMVFGTRDAETGILFSNAVLIVLYNQPDNTILISLPGLSTGFIALDDVAQPQTITVGVDMTGQIVKAWMNGQLVVDDTFTSGTWDDDTSAWRYVDDTTTVNASLIEMEAVLGALPAIF